MRQFAKIQWNQKHQDNNILQGRKNVTRVLHN
jgi:hypothetical protein